MDMTLSALDGKLHTLGMEQRRAKAVALVVLDPLCPIGRRYSPTLEKSIAPLAAKHGVQFYGIISSPHTTLAEAKKYAADFGLTFPILLDVSGDLAAKLKPTHLPEAFLIGKDDTLVYRGRIDDWFIAPGKRRPQPTTHDFVDAIRSYAAGKKPLHAQTVPVGCVFEGWPKEIKSNKITYNRHIAPIINANCIECHRSGGVGPFPLQNYKQVKKKAKMSVSSVVDGLMPPWKADANAGNPPFRHERRLSERQIDLLEAWLENGAPEGEPDELLPPPPLPKDGWRSGTPDLVLTMPKAFPVPAEGKDIYRYFVIPCPPEMKKDFILTGIDFKPGDPSVVHHCDYFIDYTGKARAQKSNDGKPGFSVKGTGGFLSYTSSSFLGAWAPGSEPYRLAEGQGIALPGGGDIVLEVHYHITGKEALDQSSIALYFAKKPVREYVRGLFIGTQDVVIPAGKKDYWREVWLDIPANLRLLDIGSHMHYLGRESHIMAHLPNGKKMPLLSISDWDLNWQTGYFYREPVRLPKGTKIQARFRYDNSADNIANPHNPPREVRWGWGTDEEMCEAYLTVILDDEKDWPALQRAQNATWMRKGTPGQGVPKKLNSVITAKSLTTQSLYAPAGEKLLEAVSVAPNFDAILMEVEKIAVRESNQVLAHVAHGVLLGLSTVGEDNLQKVTQLGTQADAAFDRAIALDQWSWDAWMAKAELYAYSQDPNLEKQAVKILRELIKYQKQDRKPLPKYQKSSALLKELTLPKK